MKIRKPIIKTDGGPWALHNYACAVCQVRHAVLDLNQNIYLPCWQCQAEGWKLSQHKHRWRK